MHQFKNSMDYGEQFGTFILRHLLGTIRNFQKIFQNCEFFTKYVDYLDHPCGNYHSALFR